MATSAMFLAMGWTATSFAALAVTIGGVVCIASANAGNTSQDLKTGFLVGATPKYQQYGLMVGVLASVFAIGFTLMGMNKGLEEFRPAAVQIDMQNLPSGVTVEKQDFNEKGDRAEIRVKGASGETTRNGSDFVLLNALGSRVVADGKYLVNKSTGQVEVQWIQGIGSEQAAAPQARLMATVINGILTQKLPWGLVLFGVFLVIAVELLGIRSLSFAVGAYLSIGTTLAIFCGGIVRWLVERGSTASASDHDSEVSPGSLYASGLIAAGGIVGLIGIALKIAEDKHWIAEGALKFNAKGFLGFLQHDWVSVLMFAALGYSLFHFARKPLETSGGK
jgi:uncharacterized oligopeptide transporter (OPT) family protein